MDDTVRRQMVIDALADMHCKSDEDGYVWIIRSDAWARIDALPSAQPEIIRCKDCKWFGDIGCAIEIVDDSDRPSENDFCSYAERITDG